MGKRKEAGSSSSSCCCSCSGSEVHNLESFRKFDKEIESMALYNKKRVTARKLDLGAGVRVKFLDVQLNGAPFFDFFAKEGKGISVAESGGAIDRPVVRLAKRRKVLAVDSDRRISERGCFSDETLNLSLSISDETLNLSLLISEGLIPDSDCGATSKSCLSCETTVCSEVPTDFDAPPTAAVPLRMCLPDPHPVNPSEVEWTMRKTLSVSDCNSQHRLLISKKQMEGFILPHLDQASQVQIGTLDGLRINVLDCNMGNQAKLTLKKWPTAKYYYTLTDSWKKDFVNRRGLKPGDEVGLCWQPCHNRLLFAVLKSSPLMNQ